MNIVDRAGILEFHRQRTEEFGAGTPASLGWLAPNGQSARFEALAGIGDLDGCSVLDVGCGHGDLSAFLRERHADIDYAGIDHSEAFLRVAGERYGGQPNTKFYLGDFSRGSLPVADYVLACGALNYRCREPGFVPRMIGKLFASCRIGLGFNLLSRVGEGAPILAAHEPKAIVEHCLGLTPEVVLIDDYLPDDFTVFLYRPAA